MADSQNLNLQWLQTSIRIFGAGQLIFFLPALLILPFRVDLPKIADILLRWGPGGAEQYEEMISIIYAVWGWFTIKAAANPFKHALFLDFTLYANAAHFSVMTLMAVINERDRIHLIGDVLLGWLGLIPFAYFWILVRQGYHSPKDALGQRLG